MVSPAALHSGHVRSVPSVQSGLDVLLHHRLGLLRGRRVGVLAHQASVDSRLEHAVPLIADVRSARLTTLFAPEHGVWGAQSLAEQAAHLTTSLMSYRRGVVTLATACGQPLDERTRERMDTALGRWGMLIAQEAV